MYPTLGHLLSDIFGTSINFPIPTYGTMLVLAFLAAYAILHLELKRKERMGQLNSFMRRVEKGKPASATELIFSGFVGFLLGYKLLGIIFNYSSFSSDVEDYVFSGKGNFIGGILGAGLLVWLSYRDKAKSRLPEPQWTEEEVHPHQIKGNILLIAAISGIIGAKVFHQFENWQEFTADPIGALFSRGGLTFYGGLIFGFAAVLWYCHTKKLNILHMMDAAAPAIILAYGTGRIGCMLAGDGCWGVCNLAYAQNEFAQGLAFAKPGWLSFLPDWMFAYSYPNNVLNEGIPIESCDGRYCHVLDNPVFPTPFYETTLSYIIFLVLWVIRKRLLVPGALFASFMMMNGVERFLIEKIRVNNKFDLFGMQITQAEIISSLLFISGAALLTALIIYHKKNTKSKA
jgi:phosphatidylglycerol---prolipoprotein diacylglyceryl transferase